MNILVGVISPAPAWVMPKHFVDQLRRDFPHHTFSEAWDRDAIRRLLPDADAAFTPFVDRDVFRSAYGKAVSASQLWYADYNGNGLVDAADLFQFNQRRKRQ